MGQKYKITIRERENQTKPGSQSKKQTDTEKQNVTRTRLEPGVGKMWQVETQNWY